MVMKKEESLIPYAEIVRDALRAVPARLLREVQAQGLPGDHHFFIEFYTDADGVQIPASLKAQYPEKMTIVLQHDFEDLCVDEEGFSVNLGFSATRSVLYIPFAAMSFFLDPSVEFALQFAGALPTPAKRRAKPAPATTEAKPAVTETKGNVVAVDFGRKSEPR